MKRTVEIQNYIALQKAKRKLFYSLLLVIALLLIATAFLLAPVAANGLASPTRVGAGTWMNRTLVNIGSGLIILVILALIVRWYLITETNEFRFQDELRLAGITRIRQNWTDERPASNELFEMFTHAEIVQILCVTFYRSLIGFDWFPIELTKRLKDPGKTTQILLLEPTGNEMQRRETENKGTRLQRRGKMSRDQVRQGLSGAGVADEKQILRFFDHAPAANIVRFDDRIYVVLLLHGQGGRSPALEATAGGWVFKRYIQHFTDAWRDTESRVPRL